VRALIAVVILLAAPASALACPQTSTSDIADEVMCLQCGVPLNLAEDAPSAKRERAFIQQLVDRCRSKDQIKTALVAQFGHNVLADPRSKATWLVPAIGFTVAILGLGLGVFQWRRRRGTGASQGVAAVAPTGDEARLQADMDRYEL
jgi:cytochrome c-type biogenesis protein CcmH/NrfF